MRAIERPLGALFPSLGVPFLELGELPTPIERLKERELGLARPLYLKRDDRSSPIYGGNKVRTLETLFARALARGRRRIFSTGAYGSNHALATALHAPRAGLIPGALLFPQPPSSSALENLRALLEQEPQLWALPHWSALPFGQAYFRLRERARGEEEAEIMVPGGATPTGALGYVSAALELAQQIEEGAMPAPSEIVVGVGSTCTSAGLLLGLHLAARRGLGFSRPPRLVCVRVTPWPVTAAFRILGLARRTAALLHARVGEPEPSAAALRAGLRVDGSFLGRGYGYPTEAGREAIDLFRSAGGPALDTTYSAKSAAAALSLAREQGRGPVLYWATKSSLPLPPTGAEPPPSTPAPMRRWIQSARKELLRGNRSSWDVLRRR